MPGAGGAEGHPGMAGSPELLDKWLDNQNKQVEAKARETELQFQQDNHSFEFGKLSLAAQERDREKVRKSSTSKRRDLYILIIVLFVVLAGLVAFAIWLNKDDLAKELVKDIGLITAGAVGGYGASKIKAPAKSDTDDTE